MPCKLGMQRQGKRWRRPQLPGPGWGRQALLQVESGPVLHALSAIAGLSRCVACAVPPPLVAKSLLLLLLRLCGSSPGRGRQQLLQLLVLRPLLLLQRCPAAL